MERVGCSDGTCTARAAGQGHYSWYTRCHAPCSTARLVQSPTFSRQAESDEDSIGDSDGQADGPPPTAVVPMHMPNAAFNAKVRNGAGRATLHVERGGMCACMVYRAESAFGFLRLPSGQQRVAPAAGALRAWTDLAGSCHIHPSREGGHVARRHDEACDRRNRQRREQHAPRRRRSGPTLVC